MTEHLDEPELTSALLKCVSLQQNHPASDETETPPVDRVGPYLLLRRLGRGGMASVYLACHQHLDRLCAIKLLPLSGHRDHLDRFRREMKALAAVDHPNVVAATDAGDDPPWHYLVMQYVDGVDLSQVIDHAGSIDVGSACAIASSVAQALSALHQAGLIHRDIKPSNVMLTRDGTVKLLDFGLAGETADRITNNDRLTTVGQVVGTITYASPEQLAGEILDARSDLYSLSVTLYRMIAGQHPHGDHASASLVEVLYAKTSREPAALKSIRGDVPAALSDLLTSMLHRDPNARSQTAQSVADQLDLLADHSGLADWVTQTIDDTRVATPAWPVPTAGGEAARGRRRFTLRWTGGRFLAAALVAIGFVYAAAFGFLFRIQTDQGTLVIRSDRKIDVEVTPLNGKSPARTMRIKQGDNQTVIDSGRYRIVASPAINDIELTPSTVTIAQDKVAVVTASTPDRPTALEELTKQFDLTDDDLQRMFEGRSISQHIETISNDLSIDAIAVSTRAILSVLKKDDVALAQFLLSPARHYGSVVSGSSFADLAYRYMNKGDVDLAKFLLSHARHSGIVGNSRSFADPARRYMTLMFGDGEPAGDNIDHAVDLDAQLMAKVGLAPFINEFREGNDNSRAAVLWSIQSNPIQPSKYQRASLVKMLLEYQSSKDAGDGQPTTGDDPVDSQQVLESWNVDSCRMLLLRVILDSDITPVQNDALMEMVDQMLQTRKKSEKELIPQAKKVMVALENHAAESNEHFDEQSLKRLFDFADDFHLAKRELAFAEDQLFVAAMTLSKSPPLLYVMDDWLDAQYPTLLQRKTFARFLDQDSSDESLNDDRHTQVADAFLFAALIHSRFSFDQQLGNPAYRFPGFVDGNLLTDDWVRPGPTPIWLPHLSRLARETNFPATFRSLLQMHLEKLEQFPPDYLPKAKETSLLTTLKWARQFEQERENNPYASMDYRLSRAYLSSGYLGSGLDTTNAGEMAAAFKSAVATLDQKLGLGQP